MSFKGKDKTETKKDKDGNIIDGNDNKIGYDFPKMPQSPKNEPFEVIKEYITKDVKERSELNKGEIRALTFLHVIAQELDWEFTKNFCEHYLHLMRSYQRKGIGEDIQLLTGFVTQAQIAMNPLGYSLPMGLPMSPKMGINPGIPEPR